ncbi:hypothetical protein HY249_02325, partial [Candidatus Azambacteria bacterium]|nr:hypothetical protein [Candidatus Azambacteria bacterium]
KQMQREDNVDESYKEYEKMMQAEENAKAEISNAENKEAGMEVSAYFPEAMEEIMKRPAFFIQEGRNRGVPEEALKVIGEKAVENGRADGDFSFVHRFMRNIKIWTDEEVRSAGEELYRLAMDDKNFRTATELAREVYGVSSPEFIDAEYAESYSIGSEVAENKPEKEEGFILKLPKDATFSDLSKAIDDKGDLALEVEDIFQAELIDNFNADVQWGVDSLMEYGSEKAKNVKIIEFFENRGYSKEEIEALLPIEFE